MLRDLQQDVDYYHRLNFPDRTPTLCSKLRVIFRSRGLFVLAVHRMLHAYLGLRPRGPLRFLLKVSCLPAMGRYLVRVLAKSELVAEAAVDGGVYLADAGYLIVGARSIGAGTIIHERVTIGQRHADGGMPHIGPNVWIGPDCVIYGNITIGAGVTVLPHTVVSQNVPAGAVVQGNPPHLVRRNFDNSLLRRTCSADVVLSEFAAADKESHVRPGP